MRFIQSAVNWARDFLEGGADERYDEYEEYEEYDEPVDKGRFDRFDRAPASDRQFDIETDFYAKDKRKRNNVYEFSSGGLVGKDGKQVVFIMRPLEIEDATVVCSRLQDGQICIINMHDIDHSKAQRLADYLAGVAYALNGTIERIDNYIFVMAPEAADITNDLKAEIQASDIFKSFATKR